VGSNPITSTKSPVQRLESGSPAGPKCADERYIEIVEVMGLKWTSNSKRPAHGVVDELSKSIINAMKILVTRSDKMQRVSLS
jgi:hypothetical protein